MPGDEADALAYRCAEALAHRCAEAMWAEDHASRGLGMVHHESPTYSSDHRGVAVQLRVELP